MISVKNLTRKYGSVTAVESVSFQIPKGQIVGLLGHNGAGKTTTLKMITGYLEPTSGDILIDGHDITADRLSVQQKIGYLSEQSPLYPDMTVWQYLLYVAKLRGIPEAEQIKAIKEAAFATDILDRIGDTIDTLSKGYRQRVGVAQAIIHKPEILILDEPTNGLDPTQIQAMRELIKSLAKNATVIISTHIMQEVEAVCDRVLIVLKGKLVVDATLADLQRMNNITLGVRGSFEEIKSTIASLPGITGVEYVETHDGIVQCRLITEDEGTGITPKVAKAVFEKGFELHHIHREHRNLEAVFKEVNKRVGGAHV